MNHGAARTHLSHNRLLNQRGSHGVRRRAKRTKEQKKRAGEDVCGDLFDDCGAGADRYLEVVISRCG